MAGHSKWENIKRNKAKADNVKGKKFATLSQKISSVVHLLNNVSVEKDCKLRSIIEIARKNNMPLSCIDKACNSGTFNAPKYSLVFEIYVQGGIGVILDVECLNKHIAISSINSVLKKYNLSISSKGSVAYMFKEISVITVDCNFDEERALEISCNLDFHSFEIYKGYTDFFVKKTQPILPTMNSLKEVYGDKNVCTSKKYVTNNLIDCSTQEKELNSLIIHKLKNLPCVINIYHNLKN